MLVYNIYIYNIYIYIYILYTLAITQSYTWYWSYLRHKHQFSALQIHVLPLHICLVFINASEMLYRCVKMKCFYYALTVNEMYT